jgi:hypothetical protein
MKFFFKCSSHCTKYQQPKTQEIFNLQYAVTKTNISSCRRGWLLRACGWSWRRHSEDRKKTTTQAQCLRDVNTDMSIHRVIWEGVNTSYPYVFGGQRYLSLVVGPRRKLFLQFDLQCSLCDATTCDTAKVIWGSWIPLRCKLATWLFVGGRVRTAGMPTKRGLPHNKSCMFCGSAQQDSQYLLVVLW